MANHINHNDWQDVECKRATRTVLAVIDERGYRIEKIDIAWSGTVYIRIAVEDELIDIRIADHECVAGKSPKTRHYTRADVDVAKTASKSEIIKSIDDAIDDVSRDFVPPANLTFKIWA